MIFHPIRLESLGLKAGVRVMSTESLDRRSSSTLIVYRLGVMSEKHQDSENEWRVKIENQEKRGLSGSANRRGRRGEA